ncbi:putative beta-1,4-mannosyl-glycoprotein beta-1,4-N-acetylglucosaminyltransferase [Tritrichomonas foetus]|uniref:Beta-1,4-mannosyl-glycoprotein beta-1,4-N-acetylglucosaminyltransferase n=1 Tax=Tritrichomonas foetus TaxID=1144522 RepID=A0A1J4JBP9_9EUKA|nr:putative beta-1,4-mannosyl-glycoprotein beta-1,4-N-acetylglucosaminyltransferase [Tritrichomonas foetus]|eukprot:OHS95075.1 putative beta-1,4-mannosyl-glycoprotein beta-1,4-N-acetylglucosaminyltransferase [Tritrichomonas foetus]
MFQHLLFSFFAFFYAKKYLHIPKFYHEFEIFSRIFMNIFDYDIFISRNPKYVNSIDTNESRSSNEYISLPRNTKIRKFNFGNMENQYKDAKFNEMTFRQFLTAIDLGRNFKNNNKYERYSILNGLTNFVIKEPMKPINEVCEKKIFISMNCSDYPKTFTGERSLEEQQRIKIGHLIQFGFDADLLEIFLNEVYDEIDKFFIVESQESHFLQTPKDLVWPLLSEQPRFAKFRNKIVYIVITHEMIQNIVNQMKIDHQQPNIWLNEGIQEKLRWEFFLEWNEKNDNYFKDDDIIGFGDTDEIPSFMNLRLLKKCNMRGTTDIGIWFTFGQINKYFYSDFPIRGHRNTLGDPTYFILRNAKNQLNTPSRNRGKSPYYLLGGIHLTRYRYLPSLMMKEITQTEANGATSLMRAFSMNKSMHEIALILYQKNQKGWESSHRYLDLKPDLINQVPYLLPWFLGCNLERYPSFMENPLPDPRIEP